MGTRRKSGDERRAEIAEAALKIISSRGVQRLTAVALADEVGITDGSIFRHFKDKRAIVRAAIERLEQMLFDQGLPGHPEPLERLGAFFLQRLGLVQKLPHVFFAAFSDRLAEAAGDDASLVHALVERSQRFVRECLEEAKGQGLIGADLSIDALGLLIVGTLQGAAISRQRARKAGPSPAQLWATIERLLRATADA